VVEDAGEALPDLGEVSLGEVAVKEVVGSGLVEFDDRVRGRAIIAGAGAEATAAVKIVRSAEPFHFDDDIDKPRERARAARGLAAGAGVSPRVVGEEDADVERSQALKGSEGFEHEGSGVFFTAGQEGGEGVDDHEVKAFDFLESDEAIYEKEPFFVARLATEGPAEPGEVVAEGQPLRAKAPKGWTFLRNDDGSAACEGLAGERSSGP
jgi:hypothetical protein